MVFSSLLFLFLFLPLVASLYFIIPQKARNGLLFAASLVFYAWGEPVYIVLMLFSTVLDYTTGRLAGKFRAAGQIKRARLAVLASAVGNLALLGTFKYGDFLLENLNILTGLNLPLLQVALPIGISFYTFQTMSYTLDVYRGDAPVQRNIISFGAYVTLFPQLIAGPIVRFSTIAAELDHRVITLEGVTSGIRRFIIGLAKKVLIANLIGQVWDQVRATSPGNLSSLSAWLGLVAFGLQIYFDFSAYSDMAIGLGRIFGFHFLENFNYPYLARSITDFWRRWHISLGTWFREYVYIPLGGNRRGRWIQIRNILIVWTLTGIWHGASWNFLLWGLYFGLFLLLEKLFLGAWLEKLPRILRHTYTLLVVLLGWVLFEFESMTLGWAFLRILWGRGTVALVDRQALYLLTNNLVLFLVAIIGASGLPVQIVHRLADRLHITQPSSGSANGFLPAVTPSPSIQSGMSFLRKAVEFVEPVSLLLLAILSTAFLVDATYNPFLYFRF